MQYLLLFALGAFFFKDKIFKKSETQMSQPVSGETMDYKDTPYVSDKKEPSKSAIQGQTKIETKSGLVTSLGSNPDLVVKDKIKELGVLKQF